MTDSLDQLKAKIIDRLPQLDHVSVYEEPLNEDAQRHLFPNHVRIRIVREQRLLRLQFSGLIILVHPEVTKQTGETGKTIAEVLFPNNTPFIMPPIYFKEGDETRTFDKLITKYEGGKLITVISAKDGGLGQFAIPDTLDKAEDTLSPAELIWHPPIYQIYYKVAEVMEEVK